MDPEIVTSSLKVMTFNLRTDTSVDLVFRHSWSKRKDSVIQSILSHQPDVICTQEGLYSQLEDILKQTHHFYSWFGSPRGSVFFGNEHCAIFYRKDKFTLIEHGTFWLSETPAKSGSVFETGGGFFSSLSTLTTIPRIVTWGKLKIARSDGGDEGAGFDGSEFCVASTHWGLSQSLHFKSLDVISNELPKKVGTHVPIILGGDFNTNRYSEVWKKAIVMGGQWKDSWTEASKKLGENSPTFHGYFGRTDGFEAGSGHIDMIWYRNSHNNKLTTKSVRVVHTEAEDKNGNVTHPSDHYPVMAEFLYPDR